VECREGAGSHSRPPVTRLGRKTREVGGLREPPNHGNQILIVWSTLPVATTFTSFSGSADAAAKLLSPLAPFADAAPAAGCRPHARVATKWLWASTVLIHRPVARSQTRTVLSSEAERRYLPEGWKARARTQLSCPGYFKRMRGGLI
jgi:hypothetical protein